MVQARHLVSPHPTWLPSAPSWHSYAKCTDDPETYAPAGTGKHYTPTEAERLCAGCPVKAICLESALEEERGNAFALRDGYRGGKTPFQRYLMDLEEAHVMCHEGLHPLWLTASPNGTSSGCRACAQARGSKARRSRRVKVA